MATSSAASVLGPYVAARVADLERLDPLAQTGDAEAIHDMRVSARRLKSTLVAYGSIFESSTAHRQRFELDWLAETLGLARDHEVQSLILRDVARRSEIDEAHQVLAIEAQVTFAAAVASERYRKLAKELTAFSADPPWTKRADRSARKVLINALERQFDRVEARIADVGVTESVDELDDRLHTVRKSVKRARYATEASVPVLGETATDVARQLARIQDTLGTHNDLVVTRVSAPAWAQLGVTSIDDDAMDRLTARTRTSRDEAEQALRSLEDVIALGRSLRK